MNLIEAIVKIPLPKLVEMIGSEVIKGIQEFGIGDKPIDMAQILCDLQGYEVFRTPGFLRSILWTLDHNSLEELNQYFSNVEIEDYEAFRDDILSNSWGDNKFSKAILLLFEIEDESYLKPVQYSDIDTETIIPRLSLKHKEFEGQKITIPEMYPLHPFQKGTKDRLLEELFPIRSKTMLHMPTGSGKTKTTVESIIDFWRVLGKRSGYVVWFAHSKELCEQAYDTFKSTWIAKGDYPIQMAKVFDFNNPDLDNIESGIIFIGFQKFNLLINSNDPIALRLKNNVRLIVVDEAHKTIATTFKRAVDYLLSPDTRLLGLTATPGRSSDKDAPSNVALSSYYNNNKVTICDDDENEIYDPIRFLQKNKYLASLKRIKIDSEIEFTDDEIKQISNAKKSNSKGTDNYPGDIIRKLTTNNIRNFKIINEIEKAVFERSDPTLVFSTNSSHAVILKILLNQKGINSECVLSKTPSSLRAKYIRDFKNNDLPVLINYGVLTTGFDAPNIRTLVISRPTSSIILYSQMLGRALRGPKMGGESHQNNLVDVIDNYCSFGTEDAAFNFFDEYYAEN